MKSVAVSDLRRRCDEVVDRLARGESVLVTRHGVPVAELRSVRRRAPGPAELIASRRRLPSMDPRALRADVDAALSPSL